MSKFNLPKNPSLIIDFNTLSQNPSKCVVVSCAILEFHEEIFVSDDPYTFEQLYFHTGYMKFKVDEQVKNYKRVIDQDTIKYWSSLPSNVRKLIQPESSDVSIEKFYSFLRDNGGSKNLHNVYVRGTGFDSVIIESLCKLSNKEVPYHWGKYRDVRSFIEGLSYGTGLDHNFMIDEYKDKVCLQDPRHSVIMDVLRIQTLVRSFGM